MTIQESFSDFMRKYPAAYKRVMAADKINQKPLRKLLDKVESSIKDQLSIPDNICISSKVGQSNPKKDRQIVYFLNEYISSRTQGFYVIILFNFPENSVSISLTQGFSSLKKEFGTQRSNEILSYRRDFVFNKFESSFREFGFSYPDDTSNPSACAIKKYKIDDDFSKKLTSDLSSILSLYLNHSSVFKSVQDEKSDSDFFLKYMDEIEGRKKKTSTTRYIAERTLEVCLEEVGNLEGDFKEWYEDSFLNSQCNKPPKFANGCQIDALIEDSNGDEILCELKSIKNSGEGAQRWKIRSAIGQLLEYSYTYSKPTRICLVLDAAPSKEMYDYIKFLSDHLHGFCCFYNPEPDSEDLSFNIISNYDDTFWPPMPIPDSLLNVKL